MDPKKKERIRALTKDYINTIKKKRALLIWAVCFEYDCGHITKEEFNSLINQIKETIPES